VGPEINCQTDVLEYFRLEGAKGGNRSLEPMNRILKAAGLK
jgi:hypothetical protein